MALGPAATTTDCILGVAPFLHFFLDKISTLTEKNTQLLDGRRSCSKFESGSGRKSLLLRKITLELKGG